MRTQWFRCRREGRRQYEVRLRQRARGTLWHVTTANGWWPNTQMTLPNSYARPLGPRGGERHVHNQHLRIPSIFVRGSVINSFRCCTNHASALGDPSMSVGSPGSGAHAKVPSPLARTLHMLLRKLSGKNNGLLPRRLPTAPGVVQARVRSVVGGDRPSPRRRSPHHKALEVQGSAAQLSASEGAT